MPRFAQTERAALCNLLLAVGPDAQTLCEGWTAADLAAHLYVRERRPDTAPGAVLGGRFPGWAQRTDRILGSVRDGQPWEQLVAKVRSGPPAPLRPVDEIMNMVEYFVHHEDVRRAQPVWGTREVPADELAALWARLRQGGRLLARSSPTGLMFSSPGYGEIILKRGTETVTATGDPGELTMFIFGRGTHSAVQLEGDELSIGRLREASFGI